MKFFIWVLSFVSAGIALFLLLASSGTHSGILTENLRIIFVILLAAYFLICLISFIYKIYVFASHRLTKKQVATSTLSILSVAVLIWLIEDRSKSNNNSNHECTTNGTRACIDQVRSHFTKTGKTILGEEYLNNGIFGITFMDSEHPGAFTARVYTDCKCNITNADVNTIR
jgi:hypothetical protein